MFWNQTSSQCFMISGSLKTGFFAITATLMVAGYLASVTLSDNQSRLQWARAVDVPSVRLLMLLLLAGTIALGFVKEKETEADQP